MKLLKQCSLDGVTRRKDKSLKISFRQTKRKDSERKGKKCIVSLLQTEDE